VKLVVATFNRDKQRELEELLGLPGVTLLGLRDFAGATAPVEDGATLLDNARIKARAAFALTGLPSIADDTGLEVDALDGRPGVHAARFAGPDATYADNVRLLLESLAGVPPERRTARFRTVCVAVLGPGDELEAAGVLEGSIATAPRGANGFGYDPVFEIAGTDRTLAQMTSAGKNALSHRARAAHALAAKLAGRVR
jgi:XTP/dITP diphosphohydrolase